MKWEKPQNEKYTIDVDWNPQARIYTLTLKSPHIQAPIVQWGQSLAFSLRELANRLEESGKFGSDEELVTDPKAFQKDTDCKYCSAPIMFAVIPPNSKWLAFDVKAVQAEKCRGTRLARFGATMMVTKNGRYNQTKRATWISPTTTGPAWVPHPETCGVKTEPPISPGVKELWQEHRAQFQIAPEETNDVIAGLKAIAMDAAKVKEGIQDDLS
jgi:hypothetical protein